MSVRSEDELLRIVGAERAMHPETVVAEAEAELRGLAKFSRIDAESRLRTATRIAILFGLISAFMPVALLQGPMFPEGREPIALQAGPWIQAILGVLVGVGGIGLWKRRSWGANLIVLVLRAAMVVAVIFHAFFAVEATRGVPPTVRLLLAVVTLLFGLLTLAMLQRGVTYLSESGLVALLDEKSKQHAG